jgi:hypothetical protein
LNESAVEDIGAVNLGGSMDLETWEQWPALPLAEWSETCATLHMWTQVVGKVRLALAPMQNHWWQVPLYLTARGMTTSAMPAGRRTLQIDFDFISHELQLVVSDGSSCVMPLASHSVADFYRQLMYALEELGIPVRIWTKPQEVEVATPFEKDMANASYDPEFARRHWHILSQAERVLQQFRTDFTGKCSPIHFFWGSFDLAVTRFSGREAPPHPGGVPNMADWVAREAYSHEVHSVGFWPGNKAFPEPAFYAYAYPEPEGFRDAPVMTEGAYYSDELQEYLLPYESVRRASDPDARILDFARSTYEAAATLGEWPRSALEPRIG